jgi:tetratricopeptide (TPR) repeat protein
MRGIQNHFTFFLATTCLALKLSHPAMAQDAFRKSAGDRGYRALEAGRYEMAETLFTAAVKAGSRNGTEDAATVRSLRGLATVRLHQGRVAEAVDLLGRAVRLAEICEGPATRLTADSVHDLASAYAAAADYENSETLYLHAKALREELLGAGHPDVAASLNNLGSLSRSRGLYEEARALYEEAFSITGLALGPEHPECAAILNNLAGCCIALGSYDEAEDYAARALKIRMAQFGDDHPATAACLSQQGKILRAVGDYRQAAALHRRAWQINMKYFGADHLETALQARAIALLEAVEQPTDETSRLLDQALEVIRRQPRGNGSAALRAITRTGLEQADEGRFSEAEAALATAWRISEQQYGPDAPETLRLLRLTADAVGAQGRSEERMVLRGWAEQGYGSPRTLNVARQSEADPVEPPSR